MRTCSIDGCERKHNAKGLCQTHYWRQQNGKALTPPIGPRNQFDWSPWRINNDGYVMRTRRPGPGRQKQQWQLQHREVMAEVIGRPLYSHEEAHHKNGVRHDNRPENLELWVKSQPAGQRAVDLLNWAREIIDTYAGLEETLCR